MKSSKCFWTKTPSLSSTFGIFCVSAGRLLGIWSSSKPSLPSSSLGAPLLSEGGPRGRPPSEELDGFPRRCLVVLEGPSDMGKPASLDAVAAVAILDNSCLWKEGGVKVKVVGLGGQEAEMSKV